MCKIGLYICISLSKWGMHRHSLGVSTRMQGKGALASGIHALFYFFYSQ